MFLTFQLHPFSQYDIASIKVTNNHIEYLYYHIDLEVEVYNLYLVNSYIGLDDAYWLISFQFLYYQ